MIAPAMLLIALALVQSTLATPTLFPRQAGIVPPNSTVSLDPAYPTNVGFLGPTKAGQAPFLAETDRINTTCPKTGASIELRYTPLNGTAPCNNGSDNITSSSTPIAQLWGNTSPYFPSPIFPKTQKYRQIDEQCTIEKVIIIHRHGSRYPTSSPTEGAPYFGQLIANATAAKNLSVSGPLAFLSNWTYKLGAELLVPQGAQEEFNSGIKHYYDYGALYNETKNLAKPVIRTTSESRMLESAQYWTAGFFGLNAPNMIDLQVILEGDGFNNTLAPYDTCNNSNTITVGDTYLTPVWEKIYLKDAAARLQKYVQSGFNVTTKEAYGMQSLCAYETVGLGYSQFCELFTEEEWKGFEYFLDLQFQGDYGFMSPNGKAQGIGLAQDILARLTNSTVPADQVTTQNTTILPVPNNQTIYADFTHDDNVLSTLTALNFTQVAGEYLPANSMDERRTFVLSHITPFAARLVFEIASCKGSDEKIIRTILNDALVPMDEGQGCAGHANGTCNLNDFIKYQNENAYKAANFDTACFGTNGTDFTITGPSTRNGTVG
ncbi:phosphoglycerate mutase-like protein [Meira miltonrushii]|uniref:Phosphoglycerate mutase-like protein n=1 Tax=Meira miltonrushii TaxID=1280837 RepID=A0A316VAV1_9BASI|nr:phosphoglycerate mutase-like protein [Meira miltonrushii]PWN34218.1 phosphoglycerate mutase-like protein [Meira miltonrushii]